MHAYNRIPQEASCAGCLPPFQLTSTISTPTIFVSQDLGGIDLPSFLTCDLPSVSPSEPSVNSALSPTNLFHAHSYFV